MAWTKIEILGVIGFVAIIVMGGIFFQSDWGNKQEKPPLIQSFSKNDFAVCKTDQNKCIENPSLKIARLKNGNLVSNFVRFFDGNKTYWMRIEQVDENNLTEKFCTENNCYYEERNGGGKDLNVAQQSVDVSEQVSLSPLCVARNTNTGNCVRYWHWTEKGFCDNWDEQAGICLGAFANRS